MKIIKATKRTGKDLSIFINTAFIESFEKDGEGSRIYFSIDVFIDVMETPEKLLEMIAFD